jgi:hypothetical protein
MGAAERSYTTEEPGASEHRVPARAGGVAEAAPQYGVLERALQLASRTCGAVGGRMLAGLRIVAVDAYASLP